MKEKFLNISLPEIKYCITIPTKLENNIYIAKPEGNCQVNTPNIIGIIHNIIWLVCLCLGSVEGTVVIFCINHIEAPTKIGRPKFHGTTAEETRSARSIEERKILLRGIDDIPGFQE